MAKSDFTKDEQLQRDVILKQAKTTDDVNTLELLVNYSNMEIQLALLENPNITKSQKHTIMDNLDIRRLPNPLDFLEDFIETRTNPFFVVQHAPVERLLTLYNDENKDFVHIIKSNIKYKDITPDTLLEYAKSSDIRLREIAINHRKTNYEIISLLLDDEDETIRNTAISTISELDDVPAVVLENMVKSSNIELKRIAASNRKLSYELQMELAQLNDIEIHERLSRHSKYLNVLRLIIISELSDKAVDSALDNFHDDEALEIYFDLLVKTKPPTFYKELTTIFGKLDYSYSLIDKVKEVNDIEISLIMLNNMSTRYTDLDDIFELMGNSNDPRFIKVFVRELNDYRCTDSTVKYLLESNNTMVKRAVLQCGKGSSKLLTTLLLEMLEESSIDIEELIAIINNGKLSENDFSIILDKISNLDVAVAIAKQMRHDSGIDLIRKVCKYDNVEIAKEIIYKSNCPKDIIFEFATKPYANELSFNNIRMDYITSPGCPSSIIISYIEHLIGSRSEHDALKQIALQYDGNDDNVFRELMKFKYIGEQGYYTRYILQNPNCSVQLITEITDKALNDSKSKSKNIIESLVEHKNCPKNLVLRLASKYHELLAKPVIDRETLLYIISISNDGNMANYIVRNPNLSFNDVIAICEKYSSSYYGIKNSSIAEIFDNQDLSEDDLLKLSQSKSDAILIMIAGHKNCPPSLFETFLNSDSSDIVNAVAERKDLPLDLVIKYLGNDATYHGFSDYLEQYELSADQIREAFENADKFKNRHYTYWVRQALLKQPQYPSDLKRVATKDK